jgi:hypothetical protein
MRRRPQPVAPIYQPEVAARAIVRAALDGRRTKLLGSWNKLLVYASRAFPGFANHYAAVGAWDSQLTDEPIEPERPDNLFAPADGMVDAGAHGSFDREAGGFLDPTFLRSLPGAAKTAGGALVAASREHAAWAVRRSVAHRRRPDQVRAAVDPLRPLRRGRVARRIGA